MPDLSEPFPPSFQRSILIEDRYDQQLVENCHPSNWTNPSPVGKYNLVVIGAGTAGLVSAAGAVGLGAKVALVERNLMGGDCLNVGCVPSKGVIRASRAAFDVMDSREFGVLPGSKPSVTFSEAMERMRRLRARISGADSVQRFKDLGVDIYLGNARFVGPSAVEVDQRRLEFDRAVIATGGRPAELNIPGLEVADYYTNETVFTLTECPRRTVVVGAGPIGCELAQSFQRLGSQVTLLTHTRRILPREDDDAAQIVCQRMVREGMRILYNAEPRRVQKKSGETVLVISNDGQEEELVCDAILAGVGRRPNVDGIGLEVAGVKCSEKGVEVDDRLRTSNPRVYAAGDVCSRFKFTHAADAMARIVLANSLFFGRRKASGLVIPWCTYTDPEVAHVGVYETDDLPGVEVATLTEQLSHVDRAILDGEEEGFARVHYDKKSGRLLGGTIVARHAGEMISELTLAITSGLKVSALSATIHPYPTQAEVLKKIGDQYMRQRLTPIVKTLFARWFAWRQ